MEKDGEGCVKMVQLRYECRGIKKNKGEQTVQKTSPLESRVGNLGLEFSLFGRGTLKDLLGGINLVRDLRRQS